MSRATTSPATPAETDLLCEGCGYTLNGLPDDSRCPECGKPIEESVGHHRDASSFERASGARRVRAFGATTAAVLLRPTAFYRTLASRRTSREARWFAYIHWAIASVLFAVAGMAHFTWFMRLNARVTALPLDSIWQQLIFIVMAFGTWGLAVGTWALLEVTTRLASRLTTWEADYRGIRLPLPVVRRAMHYHAAHYLPVAVLAAATVLGYQRLVQLGHLDRWTSSTAYLYVLSGEVIACAAYLFHTYWIGMRNLMYANR